MCISHLPALKELLGPDLLVVSKFLHDICRALTLPGQLEVGPAALDGQRVVLAVRVRAPIAFGVNIRDVASAWVVLLVHGEVHHKAHLVGEVECEAVAGLSDHVGGDTRSSLLHPCLLVYGRLLAPRVPGVRLVKLSRPIVPLEAGKPNV